MKRLLKGSVFFLIGLNLQCGYMAVKFAPEKKNMVAETSLRQKSNDFFWNIFNNNQYKEIDNGLNLLTAAYLENPSDGEVAARIGWLHIWKLSERAKDPKANARITEHATLCKKYFTEAYDLKPDPRYLGFKASCMLAEGSIHKNEKIIREGYFLMKDAISDWPQFNYFTGGYVMSSRDYQSKQFKEAVEWQWENLDNCLDDTVDRSNPDITASMPAFEKLIQDREYSVCANNEVAPHNFEGFFLNFGDMLVKAGQVEVAKIMYKNARLIKDYQSWQYKDVLENRIKNAEVNVEFFRKQLDRSKTPDSNQVIMINSEFSCMGCHQN